MVTRVLMVSDFEKDLNMVVNKEVIFSFNNTL